MTRMPIDAVLPELRAQTLKYGRSSAPAETALQRWIMRAAMRLIPFEKAPDVLVDQIGGSGLRIRRYRPAGSRSTAAVIWIHGGGYISGVPKQDDPLCSRTAAALGIQVFSLWYPLAPEHPFPAAIDHVFESWQWLQDHADELGFDGTRVVVGGGSAGGGLAATLVQRVHDAGGTQPIGQWLFAPMLDDRTAANHKLDEPEHWIFANASNRYCWGAYLGTNAGSNSLPAYAAASRRDTLTGLPPTYIAWGDIELFADEDRAYADRLAAADVPVHIDVVEGAPHAFENWAYNSQPALDLTQRAHSWLQKRLASPSQ